MPLSVVAVITTSFSGRLPLTTPSSLTVAVLALLLACALDGIDRTPLRLVNRVLERVGRHSLEIYMSHVLVRYVVRTFFDLPRVWTLAAMLVFSYPLALALGELKLLKNTTWVKTT